MDIKRSQHKHIIVFMLVVLLSTPIAGDGSQASYNSSVNVIEQEGGILKELLEQMKELTEKVNDQAKENVLLTKRMIERFVEMDQKIEWAMTDGTLAPKNVSGILQTIQEISRQVSGLQAKLSTLQERTEYKHDQMIQENSRQVSGLQTKLSTLHARTELMHNKIIQENSRQVSGLHAKLSTLQGRTELMHNKIIQRNQAQLSTLQNDVQETKQIVKYLNNRAKSPFGVELVGGPNDKKGRLMITNGRERIGTVCDDDFGEKEAKVVCRMLGYTGRKVRFGRFYGPGSGPILLDDVKCTGNERSLFDCRSRPWGMHNCAHNEDVSIKCGF